MRIASNPRATPLAVVSYQDGVFVIKGFGTGESVICLTADTTAEVIKEVCGKYLQEIRRDKDEVSEL